VTKASLVNTTISKPDRLPSSNLEVAEALRLYSNASGEQQAVQLVRPFTAFSIKAYSTAATLPIGIAYLAGMLEKAGYATSIIDGLGEDIMNVRPSPDGEFMYQGLSTEAIVARIDPSAKIVGVSMMFSQNWLQYREVVQAIRAAYPRIIIVGGGEHATALSEFSLRDCSEIDYLITGESELSLLEFVYRIYNDLPVGDMAGLATLTSSGMFVGNGLGRRILDAKNLPWPAWHLCPVENYFTGMWSMGIGYGRNMLILATRGCPYQCTFCSNPTMWTTRYIMRDVCDVVDEIEFLIREYDCNSVDFADLTAIVKKDWILEFCDELDRRNLKITWQLPSGTRSEALDEKTVRRLYESGCKFLVYAPESGSMETLDKIKKKVKPKVMQESILAASKIGHTIKLCMIIGFPHEGRKHVLQTMGYALKMAWVGVDDCNISPYSAYPGSEIFEQLRENGTIKELDDTYFKGLLGQFDLTGTQNYCPQVPGWELAIYRFISMSGFYVLSYLFHPKRITRLISSMLSDKFQPRSLFEQRIYDYVGRRKLNVHKS
jgi:anaerobic magnesium-protoporphyrin IX monomethyl ester cyclase